MQGIIMSVKNKKAIVLKKNGEFAEIPDKGYSVGQKIKIANTTHGYLLVAACLLLCFIVPTSGYTLYNTPTSYIYVDINPSIRLDLNCFDRVINIIPLNDDAKSIVDEISTTTNAAEECIEKIIQTSKKKNYLSEENNSIEIDIATKHTKLDKKVETVCEKLKSDNFEVSSEKISKTENEKSLEQKTSPKRLKAIELYSETFGGNTEENIVKLRGVSVRDIYKEIESSKSQDTVAQNISSDNADVTPTSTPDTDAQSDKKTIKNEFNGNVENNSNRSEKKKDTQQSQTNDSIIENDTNASSNKQKKEDNPENTQASSGNDKDKTELSKEKEDVKIKNPQSYQEKKNDKTDSTDKSKKDEKSKNKDNPNLKPSEKRMDAITDYTEEFGGTVEENTLDLQDMTVKEIKEKTKEKNKEKNKQKE